MSDSENQTPPENPEVVITEPVPEPEPETPPAPDAGEPAPEPEPDAEPAADEQSPGEKLHDSAVAFIVAARVEAVDVEQYLEKKLSGIPLTNESAALKDASEDFVAKGKAMNIDFYEYIRAKVSELAD